MDGWTCLAAKSQPKDYERDGGGDNLGDGLDGHRLFDMFPSIGGLPIKLIHETFDVWVSTASCHNVFDHLEARFAKFGGGQLDFSDTVVHGWRLTGGNPHLVIVSQAILVDDHLACHINRILSGHVLWGHNSMVQFDYSFLSCRPLGPRKLVIEREDGATCQDLFHFQPQQAMGMEKRLQDGWGAELGIIAQLKTVLHLQGFLKISIVRG
eukprot:scaffold32283_cov54-Attheya_sp.AAC.2